WKVMARAGWVLSRQIRARERGRTAPLRKRACQRYRGRTQKLECRKQPVDSVRGRFCGSMRGRFRPVGPLSFSGNPMTDRLTLLRPDDWHIHLRDAAALTHTVPDAARQFARAIVMPNLVPPVRNSQEADAYRQRILAARPAGSRFEPLMVLYLTDNTTPEDIRQARASGFVHAAKLYPAGATTNSASGVTSIDNIFPVLETMAEVGLPLLVHGEVTHSEIDVFDREKAFIDTHMSRIVERFPTLKVVFEHITTADAAQFVREAPATVGATITAHHLLYNRNHMLVG